MLGMGCSPSLYIRYRLHSLSVSKVWPQLFHFIKFWAPNLQCNRITWAFLVRLFVCLFCLFLWWFNFSITKGQRNRQTPNKQTIISRTPILRDRKHTELCCRVWVWCVGGLGGGGGRGVTEAEWCGAECVTKDYVYTRLLTGTNTCIRYKATDMDKQ